ncbi:hypothetical protein IYC_02564 [Clostridium sporogenes PA 3679]|nr:hypothetical protein IYC_02564 [Clostridium sporogenes PA 3679]
MCIQSPSLRYNCTFDPLGKASNILLNVDFFSLTFTPLGVFIVPVLPSKLIHPILLDG